jgi:cephalosporin hydroxylase
MELFSNSLGLSDKNSVHSYLKIYESLFERFRNNNINIIEVGTSNGGSIALWNNYFKNANIYGVDIIHNKLMIDEIKNKANITLFNSTDAYDINFVTENFINKNIKFDILIDDGPHTLQSMKDFIKLYLPLIKDNGIFVIEDIPLGNPDKPDQPLMTIGGSDFKKELLECVKENFPEYINYVEIKDLRNIKNRYDDVMLIIDLKKNI